MKKFLIPILMFPSFVFAQQLLTLVCEDKEDIPSVMGNGTEVFPVAGGGHCGCIACNGETFESTDTDR